MSYKVVINGATGASLAVTLERESDGYFWNPGANAFQSNPSWSNRRVILTEDTGDNIGIYRATIASLGDAGLCRLRVHDTGDSNRIVTADNVFIENGEEANYNKIADHVLRRSWAEARAAGHGDAVSARSLLGAIARLANKWAVVGTNLVIYDSDNTTPFVTIALTSSDADPVVAMTPPS